jgi:hypothetical protein
MGPVGRPFPPAGSKLSMKPVTFPDSSERFLRLLVKLPQREPLVLETPFEIVDATVFEIA